MGFLKNLRKKCVPVIAFALVITLVLSLFTGLRVGEEKVAAGTETAASVTAPSFSHESGSYDSAFDLSLTAQNGCKIYYTTDGSIPEPTVDEGEDPNQPILFVMDKAHTKFDDGVTTLDVDTDDDQSNDAVQITFDHRFRSTSFETPNQRLNWTQYKEVKITFNVDQCNNGNSIQLQACPVKSTATTSSYEEENPNNPGQKIRTRIAESNKTFYGTGEQQWVIDTSEWNGDLTSVGWLTIGVADAYDTADNVKDIITVKSIELVPSDQAAGSYPLKQEAVEYTSAFKVKNRNGEPNVLCSVENIPNMYVTSNSYYPSNDQVPKATVIRAVAIDAQGNRSPVVTKTFFVGNQLSSLYKNASVISMITDPDNLLSTATGIYRTSNVENSGKDWEREAYVEYYNDQGDQNSLLFATTMGIRIHGGWSRKFGQKSFNLYFREELGGLKNLKGDAALKLIPKATIEDGTPTAKYKNFMIRNGGNDSEYTKLQDVWIQSLVADRNYTTQAARPCVLFLNGEYWGVYNVTEKYGDNYIETEFGVDKDNVVIFKNGQLDEGQESDQSLYNDLYALANLDMTVDTNYQQFLNQVDLQSYLDYYATELFIGNMDWPNNNTQLWRSRSTQPMDPMNPNPYEDGKWRWMLYDTEYSMNLYNQGGYDSYDRALGYQYGDSLLRAVMQNESFKKAMINTQMDIANKNFDKATAEAKLDELAAIYRPLMDAQYQRWGGSVDGSFDYQINRMKTFLTDRFSGSNSIYTTMENALEINSSKQCKVTLEKTADVANVQVNTINPTFAQNKWSGIYYQTAPITIKAPVKDGIMPVYSVTGGSHSDKADGSSVITLSSATATIKVSYEGGALAPSPSPTPGTSVSPVPGASTIPGASTAPGASVSPTPKTSTAPSASVKPSASPSVKTSPDVTDEEDEDVARANNKKPAKVRKPLLRKKTKKAVTVKFAKVALATHYQITYSTSKKYKKAKKLNVKVKKSSYAYATKRLTKLKSGKKYYIKVRAYYVNAKGKKIYGKYSKTVIKK